jgi:hypothetical protein
VAVLLMLNLARVRKMKQMNAKKSYSTREAASKMRVSFRTLNRWLSLGRVRPSLAIPLGGGRTLWRWPPADRNAARSGRHNGGARMASPCATSVGLRWDRPSCQSKSPDSALVSSGGGGPSERATYESSNLCTSQHVESRPGCRDADARATTVPRSARLAGRGRISR